MAGVTLRFNTAPTLKALDRVAAIAPVASARALNRAIVSARAVMVRAIAADMHVKQGDVKDRIATYNASPEQLVAKLTASAQRLPLYAFGASGLNPSRGKGRGVSARVGAARSVYPHAFIGTMRSGHVGVFERKGKARLPIRELQGPSVWHVFGKHVDEGLAAGRESLAKNLQSEFRFALSQAV